MGIISVQDQFRAKHGTTSIRESSFKVRIDVEGLSGKDFIGNVDYDSIQRELCNTLSSLRGNYLDDIVGRGTVENVAAYLMFRLIDIGPSQVCVEENERSSATIFTKEAKWINYAPLLHFKIGSSKLVRILYRDAIDEFNLVLKTHPRLAEVFNCRGRAYKHLKRLDLALQDHTRAIELNNKLGEAYRNRGNDYYELGNFDLMMSDFDQAVLLMPNSALALNNRGFAHQYFKRFDLAVLDHTQAITLDPTYSEAYSDRAKAYKELGKLDLSRTDDCQVNKLLPLQNRFRAEWSKITWPSLGADGLKFL